VPAKSSLQSNTQYTGLQFYNLTHLECQLKHPVYNLTQYTYRKLHPVSNLSHYREPPKSSTQFNILNTASNFQFTI